MCDSNIGPGDGDKMVDPRLSAVTETSKQEQMMSVRTAVGVLCGVLALALLIGYGVGKSSKFEQPAKSQMPKITWEEMDKRYAPVQQMGQVDAILGMSYLAFSNMNVRVVRAEQYIGAADKVFGMMSQALNRHETAISNLTTRVNSNVTVSAKSKKIW